MKKKLTINTLALGNLKKRKKQYAVLIIGIVLAMVFSSATIFFISCTKSSNEEFKRRTMGNFYFYLFADDGIVDVEKGVRDGYVEEYGYAHILGYAYTQEKGVEQGTPVAWLDETAKELYYPYFEEGRYPEAKGEIAIEKDAALRLGINPEIGEQITLSMQTANSTDYFSDCVEKTYTIVGILADKRKNIEKYLNTMWTPSFAAAFVFEDEEITAGGKEILCLYLNPTEKSLNEKVATQTPAGTAYPSAFESYFVNGIYDKIESLYADNYNYSNLLRDIHSFSYDTNADVSNSSILSITLAVVLMLASCIGIVNAFSSNLKERKKQIGMLRAVGATKRQIINIFGREAFLISLICAPVSVLVSYFAVKIYALLMGDSFIFVPDFTVLIITAAVSVVCVMLAALVPLISAAKISPMQAIRNVELNRKMKNKKIKTQSFFKVPVLIARRSMKLHRARQIGVTLILIITIFASSFGLAILKAELIDTSWYTYYTGDYVVRRSTYADTSHFLNMPNIDKKISLNNISDILAYPEFKSVYGYKEAASFIVTDEYSDYMKLLEFDLFYSLRYKLNSDLLTPENTAAITDVNKLFELCCGGENQFYNKLKQNTEASAQMRATVINGYDSVMIENCIDRFEVIDGKIDIDKLESGEEILLVAYESADFVISWYDDGSIQSFGIYDTQKEKTKDQTVVTTAQLDIKAGDTIKLHSVYSDVFECDWSTENYIEREHLSFCDKEVKVGAIIKPFNFSDSMSCSTPMSIVTTANGLDIVTGQNHGYENLNISFDGEIDDFSDTAATEYLNGIFAGSYFKSLSGYKEIQDDMYLARIFIISLLSVVILMFSICASIVNNALTAKIRENKKEIGTLRAVGASVKELTGIYVRQLVSMFIWGMSAGLGGYTVIHIILKLCFGKSYAMPYLIWPSLVICILLCFICSINLYFKIKQEMKHSIVENIREL